MSQRYMLMRVKDQRFVDRLLGKLQSLSGVEVIGIFAKPTVFCECEDPPDMTLLQKMNRKSYMGKRYWWRLHKECRKPRKGNQHMLRNLLDPPDMHPRDRDITLLTWEPFHDAPQ